MKIGTMFLGKVEGVDEESIQTKFFILGIPLVPLTSFYSLGDTHNGVRGFEIDMHGTSVLAGYLRLNSFIAALLFGIFAWVQRDSYGGSGGLWVGFLLSVGLLIASMFIGRISEDEKERRRMRRSLIGIGAPPHILPPSTRQDLLESLEQAWAKRSSVPWREAMREASFDSGTRELLELMSEYASLPSPQRSHLHTAER